MDRPAHPQRTGAGGGEGGVEVREALSKHNEIIKV